MGAARCGFLRRRRLCSRDNAVGDASHNYDGKTDRREHFEPRSRIVPGSSVRKTHGILPWDTRRQVKAEPHNGTRLIQGARRRSLINYDYLVVRMREIAALR